MTSFLNMFLRSKDNILLNNPSLLSSIMLAVDTSNQSMDGITDGFGVQ